MTDSQLPKPSLPSAPVPAPADPPTPVQAQTANANISQVPSAEPALEGIAATAASSDATPTSIQEPGLTSTFLQNLQTVSSQPFQDPSITSSAPTSPGITLPQDAVPKEQGSIAPQTPSPVAPAKSPTPATIPTKKATTGGLGTRKIALFAGVAVAILAVVGAIFFFLTRPGSQSADTNQPGGTVAPRNQVELTYWGLWEPVEVMQPLIDAYEQQNPGVKITYVQQNSRQYRQRLQAAVRDGSGPDMFRFHATWLPMVAGELSPAPASILTAEQLRQEFYPAVSNDLVRGTQVYGVPLMYEGLALLYNQNMFQAANALPPTDWQKVREIANQLTIRQGTRIERAGIALGTANNIENFSDILAFMMLQNAANPADPSNVNAQNALEFYTIFSRVDKVWDDTLPPSTQAFANEQVAMILAPSWRIYEIQKMNPNLAIGVTRLPQIDGTSTAWSSYWAEGVSASSRNKEESWKFLKYLSEAEQLRTLYSQAASFRGYGEMYPRVDMASELENPLLEPYLEDALFAKSWYLSSLTHDEGLNDQLIQYYKDAVNAMNQSGNAQRAFQGIIPGIQQVLSRFQVAVPSAPTQ